MGPFWTSIIVNTVLRKNRQNQANQTTTAPSRYRLAKGLFELRVVVRQSIWHLFLVCCGVLSAGIGLRSFLLPSHFLDGGATGIALLLNKVSGWPLPVLLIVVNIPFILLGIRVVGRDFALKTALSITALALSTAYLPFPIITEDKLLIAIFGGFFLGAGIGLSMRGGAVIDGTEVLAIALSRRLGITIGDVILLFNLIIFCVAAWVSGIEIALYAILTYMAASKAVDFIVEGIEEYLGVTIVSIRPEAVKGMIAFQLGRGVTVYKGSGGHGRSGYKGGEQDIVFTVITRLEWSKLKAELEKIDPNAFVITHTINDTKGGIIKKRPFKH